MRGPTTAKRGAGPARVRASRRSHQLLSALLSLAVEYLPRSTKGSILNRR